MGLNSKNIITCVEFGTSKIAALHGTFDKGGNPEVIGFGQAPSDACVCKGEIVDVRAAAAILDRVLSQADKSAGRAVERGKAYCALSGACVHSMQGEGNVMIYDEDHLIKREHVREAVEKAESISLPPDQIRLNTFDSFFVLDSRRRVQNPFGHFATRLDAFLHIISADRNRIETARTVLREVGFEGGAGCVFSAVGSVYSALRADEKQSGVFLIDIGAGLTDYILVRQDGILLSGVIPVGTDNLANDLSVGLELGIDQCRKFLTEGRFEECRSSGTAFAEFPGNVHNTKRRIPVGSFEKIIGARLSELFSIVRAEIDAKQLAPQIESGVVVTGGGSLIPSVVDSLRGVMGMHVRRGEVSGVSGAMSGIDPACRYSSLLGVFKFVVEEETLSASGSGIARMGDVLENFGGKIVKKVKDVTKVFKI